MEDSYVVKMDLDDPVSITYHLDVVEYDTINHKFFTLPIDEGTDLVYLTRRLVHDTIRRDGICGVEIEDSDCIELKELVELAMDFALRAETHLA